MGNESDWHIKLVYDLAYQNYLFDDVTVKLQRISGNLTAGFQEIKWI